MSKILSKSLILILLISLFIPFVVGAVVEIVNPITYESTAELIGALVNFLIKLAIPIATIMIVVAGIYFVISRGDPEKIILAKKMLFWTIVGLVIILFSWGLIEIIEDIFKPATG